MNGISNIVRVESLMGNPVQLSMTNELMSACMEISRARLTTSEPHTVVMDAVTHTIATVSRTESQA